MSGTADLDSLLRFDHFICGLPHNHSCAKDSLLARLIFIHSVEDSGRATKLPSSGRTSHQYRSGDQRFDRDVVDVCFFYVTDIVAASLASQIVFVFNIVQLHKAKAFTPAASFRHLGRFTLAQGLLERSFASSINKELDLLC